ncbi:hypothetical protein Tco_0974576 [Tanacetum coccineum]|uniref:Uncharacterized protein n=1 Tax=Tanacetum coccineum TaxID=301880 RepID=A0ABQ5EBY3_9ASTR
MMESVSIDRWLTDSRRPSLNEDIKILAGTSEKQKSNRKHKLVLKKVVGISLYRDKLRQSSYTIVRDLTTANAQEFKFQKPILQLSRHLKGYAVIQSINNSGINLNFDNAGCTPTILLNRSFMSSLSMDGSVTTLDGSSFHLIGSTRSTDQGTQRHKPRCLARGEDGSVKCSS